MNNNDLLILVELSLVITILLWCKVHWSKLVGKEFFSTFHFDDCFNRCWTPRLIALLIDVFIDDMCVVFIFNFVFSVTVGLVCWHLLGRLPTVDLIILEGENVRPSTKSFLDLNEIWYIGRGRWVMHDGMPYPVWPDPRSRSSHEPLKVWIPSIFKTYLLRHLQWELANDH